MKGGGYGTHQIGSLWWLSVDPAVTEFSTGYSYISFAFTCLSFPASALVSCIAVLALFRIASEAIESTSRASLANAAAAPPPATRVRLETPPGASPAAQTSQPTADGPSGQSSSAPTPPQSAPAAKLQAAGSSRDAPVAPVAAPGSTAATPPSAAPEPQEPPPAAAQLEGAETRPAIAQTGMPPSRQTHDGHATPAASRKSNNGTPRQDGLLAAAQAAYSLLWDDSDAGSGSELGGSQGVVGAAEQQLTTDGGAGDKSAPAKQQGKSVLAAGGAAGGGAAAAADGGAASGSGSGTAAHTAARAALPRRTRPRLWSVKKAAATVAAVVRDDLRKVFSTYLLVSVFESAVLLASTVFVTLPLTIPRLLNVQLALPLAAAEGQRGREAMRASKARMPGYRRTAAVMLALVFVLQKALPPVTAVLISSLPHKVIVQVPEAVVAVLLVGQVLLFGASQMKGLAALLIYNHTAHQEQAEEPAASPA